jgi:hypothetical protein
VLLAPSGAFFFTLLLTSVRICRILEEDACTYGGVPMSKVEWLLNKIEEDLTSSNRNTFSYRKAMHGYHFISLVLTAGITITTGISGIKYGKEIALCLGAAASIIAGIQLSERFYDRIFNWATYDHELSSIKERLEFYIIGKEVSEIPEDDLEIRSLFEEYQQSKKKFSETWTSHFLKEKT